MFKKENMPLVSIVMPLYNSSRFVEESINSVLSQSYLNWELIVVDDCSTDNSVKLVEGFDDSRIIILKLNENSGAAVARNKAIENSKGRFIAFLDSDDQWTKDKLSFQIDFMISNGYALTYTHYDVVNEVNGFLRKSISPNKLAYNDLLKTNYIGCLTAIYDVSMLGKVYMPLIRKRQDFGLWLIILKKIDYAYGLNKSLAFYRVHDKSLTNNKIKAAKNTWLFYRKVEKIGVLKSIYYFLHYIFIGLYRRL